MDIKDSIILIVEDNEMNFDMISRRLNRLGCHVHHAGDGEEGIEKAISVQPNIILMDMGLPKCPGWVASRQIKENTQTEHIPIIGLSARALAEDRQNAIDHGCNDYETKPVNFNRLVSKISSMLGNE